MGDKRKKKETETKTTALARTSCRDKRVLTLTTHWTEAELQGFVSKRSFCNLFKFTVKMLNKLSVLHLTNTLMSGAKTRRLKSELEYYPFTDQGSSFVHKLTFEVNPTHFFFCPTSIILHVVWLCVYVLLCTVQRSVHGLFHVETSVALM